MLRDGNRCGRGIDYGRSSLWEDDVSAHQRAIKRAVTVAI